MTVDDKRKLLMHKANVLKVIAHPARLCILSCLIRDKECHVSKLQEELDLPQSTISQHMSKLKSQGIIEGERHGVEIAYKIVDHDIERLMVAYLDEVIGFKEREVPMC